MNKWFCLLIYTITPVAIFSQTGADSSLVAGKQAKTFYQRSHQRDSAFSILFNVSSVFYTAQDSRINSFLTKYGYTPPQQVPMGIRFELAVVPFESKMIYDLSAATIISPQDISTADFLLGAYRRFYESKHIWLLGGLAMGAHYDRVVLDGNMPESFDSIAMQYGRTLSLHRDGFTVEPSVKIYWYPLQWNSLQIGLFAGAAYDFDFNNSWKLGYYNGNGTYTTFHKIKESTSVRTHQEFGWVFNGGVSVCFKFR